MIYCKYCDKKKSSDSFYKSNPSLGCKPCKNARTKKHQENNREQYRKYSKHWYFKMATSNAAKYQEYLKKKRNYYRKKKGLLECA